HTSESSDASMASLGNAGGRGRRRNCRSRAVSSPDLVGSDENAGPKRAARELSRHCQEILAASSASQVAPVPAQAIPASAATAAAAAAKDAPTSVAPAVPAVPAVPAAPATTVAPAPHRCPAWTIVQKGTDAIMGEMSMRKAVLEPAVLGAGVASQALGDIFEAIRGMNDLMTALVVRNAVLAVSPTSLLPPSCPAAPAAPVPAPVTQRARPPVETWSAVVTSQDPKLSGKEVADKIRKVVAPALGVRVHEVRELRSGGAVIRTPSQGEIGKVVANKKFEEVGLSVATSKAPRPKLTVFDVDTAITPDEFMRELYEHNLKQELSPGAFKKAVHLESKPWSSADGATINVSLEVDDVACGALEKTGRVYIK
ncbi:hypothetical protein KR093_003945, partial [Drosophila rubida]